MFYIWMVFRRFWLGEGRVKLIIIVVLLVSVVWVLLLKLLEEKVFIKGILRWVCGLILFGMI